MHKRHSTKTKGYSLVTNSAGVPLLHIVLDQLNTRPFHNSVRHNGNCEPDDTVDPLVNDDLLRRRGYQ